MQLFHASNLIVLFHEKLKAFPTVSKSNNFKILNPISQRLVFHWSELHELVHRGASQPAVSQFVQREVPASKGGMPLHRPTETQISQPRLQRESH